MAKTKAHSILREEEGQSTVEFALTMILLLAYILFFFQLSMVFSFGNYVHYATFMSARAYLASSADRGDQRSRARDVIVQMLKKSAGQAGVDKFPSIGRGVGGGDPGGFQVDPPASYVPDNQDFSWMQGVRYTFKSKLFLLPLSGAGKTSDSVNSITLTSESWLGRERAEDECRADMGAQEWIFDNGC